MMGHGMGMPSIGLYTYELYHFYGVKTIIRVGSAGAYNKDLHLGDLVLAEGACTDSNYADQYELDGMFARSEISISSVGPRRPARIWDLIIW